MTQFFKTGVGSARVDECITNEIQNFKFATFNQLITVRHPFEEFIPPSSRLRSGWG